MTHAEGQCVSSSSQVGLHMEATDVGGCTQTLLSSMREKAYAVSMQTCIQINPLFSSAPEDVIL